jgi:hypothetical protein
MPDVDPITVKADFQTLSQEAEIEITLGDFPSRNLHGDVTFEEEIGGVLQERTVEGSIEKSKNGRHFVQGTYHDVLIDDSEDIAAIHKELLRRRAANMGQEQCIASFYDKKRDLMVRRWIDEDGNVSETTEAEY